jgi:hypothetical protein
MSPLRSQVGSTENRNQNVPPLQVCVVGQKKGDSMTTTGFKPNAPTFVAYVEKITGKPYAEIIKTKLTRTQADKDILDNLFDKYNDEWTIPF